MPIIRVHASTPISAAQQTTLKSVFGKAIETIPGKSEGWLMCQFLGDVPTFFAGSDDQPAAYIEVNAFARNPIASSVWEELTGKIMPAVSSELGIAADRIYIRYTATDDWGWNGGNF